MMGNSIVARKTCRGCVVSIFHKETLVELMELDMLYIDVILGMDSHHSCYSSLCCKTQKVSFYFPNKLVFEYEGSSLVPKGRFLSYLTAQKLISKGCLYHLVWGKDSNLKSSSLQSIPMVNEFPKVFPNDLSRITPDREVGFGINLLPDMILVVFTHSSLLV